MVHPYSDSGLRFPPSNDTYEADPTRNCLRRSRSKSLERARWALATADILIQRIEEGSQRSGPTRFVPYSPCPTHRYVPSAQSAGAGVAGFSDAFAILTAPGSNQVPPPITRTPPAQL